MNEDVWVQYIVRIEGVISIEGVTKVGTMRTIPDEESVTLIMWGQCSRVFEKKGLLTPNITCGLNNKKGQVKQHIT